MVPFHNDASLAEPMDQKPLQSLSFEELSILNERKEALKKEHEAYVDAHPEIKTLLSSFMSALLLEKPSDVLAFACDHFATYKPANANVSGLLACRSPVAVLGSRVASLLS